MTSAHEPLSDNRAERLLASLAGILSAHVVTDQVGRIVEIHILSAAELHPKQVVRNVESALSAGLGIEIDRRIVSVAQIRTPAEESTANGQHAGRGDAPAALMEGAGAAVESGAVGANGRKGAAMEPRAPGADQRGAENPVRLEYVRFNSRRDAEQCACDVVLRDVDLEVIGHGSGPDTAAGRAESAARAVLDAIGQARSGLRLELEGAVISASRGRSYVIVSARAVLDRMTVPLAGAATLARSPEEAGILAALQATNRWSG